MKTRFISQVFAVFWLMFLPRVLFSQCVPPFEQGSWTNIDPNTRGITHIQIDFSCHDVVLCGVDANGNVSCTPPGPPFQVHMWGKCSPSDCDWGTVDGNTYRSPDGTYWVYAFFNQGFAKRYVYVTASRLYPGDLYMWMYTDFTDPGRPDYSMINWFHH